MPDFVHPSCSTGESASVSPSTRVPFIDLRARLLPFRAELAAILAEALETGVFIEGPQLAVFERDLARYVGTAHAIGVASGTDALRLALQAVGVGPGWAVVTTPFTFVATVEAILHTGAEVEFVDVDACTALMDPQKLSDFLDHRFSTQPRATPVRAVVPVHLYGHCADMQAITAIARRYDLPVVEDAAQALGSQYKDRRSGDLADAAAFSFYPSKTLGALGDGGAVTTHSPAIADRVRALRNHGRDTHTTHACVGWNSRLDSIHAAALSMQLPHLDAWCAKRRAIGEEYDACVARLPCAHPLVIPAHCIPSRSLYVLRTDKRGHVQRCLSEAGIGTAVHYPVPVHQQLAYRHITSQPYESAERLAQQVLSIPLYPTLDTDAIAYICTQLSRAHGSVSHRTSA